MSSANLDITHVLKRTFVAQAEYHSTLGSTNDRAGELAAQNPDELPILILADRQTAGRGRGANRWWTGPGSLTMSLLLKPDWETAAENPSPLFALAAAVAVVETVAPLLPPHAVGIHWPNDVIAAGRKLGGILVEILPNRYHVVGIGLNTNNLMADAPRELRSTAITMRELSGSAHDQTSILITLLDHLESCFAELATAPGAVATRADRLCLQRGAVLTLRQGPDTVTGRCLGITPDGALVLESPHGPQSYYSGTVQQ